MPQIVIPSKIIKCKDPASCFQTISNNPYWDQVITIARNGGFCVLDERYIKRSSYFTDAHFHLEVR